MTIEIEDSGPPLTDEQIVALESELGARLPEQYRTFLLANNGGIPRRNVVLDIEGAPFVGADVQVFFRVSGSVESSTIPWHLREAREYFPETTVPIATDGGGNLFCLSLSSESYGNVIYLDSQSGYLERTPTKIYSVADSFNDFLEKLKPADE